MLMGSLHVLLLFQCLPSNLAVDALYETNNSIQDVTSISSSIALLCLPSASASANYIILVLHISNICFIIKHQS